ncbi:NADH-quinone oxidoreductase subunit E [Roseovarius tibetensis]|uniref:NADH-quinone oxidoreductase subunit E n=1 Tax=Roseovarius tibetensis TaxID=2685897 RepID=UPI003D7F2B31
MLRRLYQEQPESFAFTPANQEWAEGEITKYPEGRQASAVIALLWRAQEQEGWLTRPAIEHVAEMLEMDFIRALEVATFYFMFQLQPVGRLAHFQVCGTTPCMLCGAEELIAVCQDKIAKNPYELSKDGNFSWEEVECLGACANAPMAQIGKDYYEDLTAESFAAIIDDLAAGKVPMPGSQTGRYASEPQSGLTCLTAFEADRPAYNASVERAVDIGDTIRRIDGTEIPLQTPWRDKGAMHAPATPDVKHNDEPVKITSTASVAAVAELVTKGGASSTARPAKADATQEKPAAHASQGDPEASAKKPETLDAPRDGAADDLKQLKGVGPKLEQVLNEAGIFHFDQVARWTADEVAWVDQNLEGFKGRASRDEWVEQAKQLVNSR